jgi:hypothetical protein
MNKLFFLLCWFSFYHFIFAQGITVGAGLPFYTFKSDGNSNSVKSNFNYNIFCKGTRYVKLLRVSYGLGFGSRNFQYRDAGYDFKRKENILVPFSISVGTRFFNKNKHTLAGDIGLAANFVVYSFQQRTDSKDNKQNTLGGGDGGFFFPFTLDYIYRFNNRLLLHVLAEEAINPSALTRPSTRPLRYYVDSEALNTFQFSIKVGIEYVLNDKQFAFYQMKEKL